MLIFHLHLVEEFVEFRHAQGLSVRFLKPGRSEQCANLEVAILGEHRHEGRVFVVLLPVGNGFLDLWLRLGYALCQRDGIEAVSQ